MCFSIGDVEPIANFGYSNPNIVSKSNISQLNGAVLKRTGHVLIFDRGHLDPHPLGI